MSRVLFLPIGSLRFSREKRKGISPRRVEELREAIEREEDVMPIRVNALGDGTYVVKDGRHRIVASLEAGIHLIEALIENIDDLTKKLLRTFCCSRSMAWS